MIHPTGPWKEWAFHPGDKPDKQRLKASIVCAKALQTFPGCLPQGLNSCQPLRRGDAPTGAYALECYADCADAMRAYMEQHPTYFLPMLACANAEFSVHLPEQNVNVAVTSRHIS